MDSSHSTSISKLTLRSLYQTINAPNQIASCTINIILTSKQLRCLMSLLTNLRKLKVNHNHCERLSLGLFLQYLTILDCSFSNVHHLDVAHLPLLIKLICKNNKIASLDLMNHQHLEVLDCSNQSLIHNNVAGQLYLNVSKCFKLHSLICYNAMITNLNLDKCSSLDYLNCSFNKLEFLDVSACTSLTHLNCNNNHIKVLVFATVHHNLLELICNYNALDTLQPIDTFPNIKSINCSNNNITSITLTTIHISLHHLSCSDNNIPSLPCSLLPAIEILKCANNSIACLDIHHCSFITKLVINNNQIQDIESVVNLHQLTDFDFTNNPFTANISVKAKLFIQLICDNNMHPLFNNAVCTNIINLKTIKILISQIIDGLMELKCGPIQGVTPNTIITSTTSTLNDYINIIKSFDINTDAKRILIQYIQDNTTIRLISNIFTFSSVVKVVLHVIEYVIKHNENTFVDVLLEFHVLKSQSLCYIGKVFKLIMVIKGFSSDIMNHINDIDKIFTVIIQEYGLQSNGNVSAFCLSNFSSNSKLFKMLSLMKICPKLHSEIAAVGKD